MWKVIVRREVRPVIDGLKGKKTGYVAAFAQLERDPCPRPLRREEPDRETPSSTVLRWRASRGR